ncbi:MAG: cyclic nucleotide-binding domain-containing protein [Candidatus Hydrogenedentota bacterium]|nr:MAG: cyclic nucleotide-binding domain-containing protein [Candidatus Hydrogenedentota bacterium]
MEEELLKVLKGSRIFEGLEEEECRKVLALLEPIKFKSGEIIFEEASPGTELYVMPRGRVSVELRLADKSVTERIYQAYDNEVFGEMALIDGHRRSARVRAMEDLEIFKVEREKLLALMEEDYRIGYKIMSNMAKILATRLRDTNLSLRNALLQNRYIFDEIQ